MPGSGQQGERCSVAGTHDTEVPMIEGGDFDGVESLGHGNDRSIDDAEGKIGVGRNQLSHAEKVFGDNRFELKVAVGQLSQEAPFC